MTDAQLNAEVELEFTFLAAALPAEIEGTTPKRLVDVYFPETGAVHPHLRLRKKGDDMEITKKQPITEGDASAQLETTIKLSQDEYDTLYTASNRRVVKDRYNVVIDGFPAEVDVFLENLKGLVLIDFEFESEEARAAFKTPAICLADVTQEEFIAGGLLAGKGYADIAEGLSRFSYTPIQ
jgi:CYTH domain-containing protein